MNGRRIQMIIVDDAYSPPKTVEQTRRLVESDEVLLIFGGVGTPTNSAVHKYLNDKKVPQLFLGSGAAKWDDPKNFRGRVAWQPTYRDEAIAYAKYIKASHPQCEGRGPLSKRRSGKGLSEGSWKKAWAAATRSSPRRPMRPPQPTIDTQILLLKSSGADVVLVAAHAEICRAGDPQDRRNRMEADDHHFKRVGIDQRRAGAGRAREFDRRDSPASI